MQFLQANDTQMKWQMQHFKNREFLGRGSLKGKILSPQNYTKPLKNCFCFNHTVFTYCCIHEQKESSKSIHCIFILLVVYRQYRQQQCSRYSFTIGSLAMSQFRPSIPLYLLSAGSLAMSQLSSTLLVLGELLTLIYSRPY